MKLAYTQGMNAALRRVKLAGAASIQAASPSPMMSQGRVRGNLNTRNRPFASGPVGTTVAPGGPAPLAGSPAAIPATAPGSSPRSVNPLPRPLPTNTGASGFTPPVQDTKQSLGIPGQDSMKSLMSTSTTSAPSSAGAPAAAK